MENIIYDITSKNGIALTTFSKVAGGDINAVYALQTKTETYILKLNNAERFPGMFQAEVKGLNLLRTTNSFQIPAIHSEGTLDDTSYLIINYITPCPPTDNYWKLFAQCLAKLHQNTQHTFGLDHDNYIGSLKQYNCPETNAADYYINQRLIPQFRMARDAGYSFEALDEFYSNLLTLIPNEPPSLIHGDLWNGNVLVASNETPTLIDPAVSYAPREMDLAMMQLFGGFPEDAINRYNEIFSLQQGWEERIQLYQLYYNLVHLNLFGTGYLSNVQQIVRLYT